MFGRFWVNACLTIFILFALGCGASFSGEGGVEPTEILDMDGEFELSVKIEKGDILGVVMKEPLKSGYKLIGASFDPAVINLIHFLPFDDAGLRRVQYMFQPEADGTTDILFKMEPIAGGDIEVFKRVTVNVGTDDSIF